MSEYGEGMERYTPPDARSFEALARHKRGESVSVECPGCDGEGQVEDTYDAEHGFKAGTMIRCSTCWGAGAIDVQREGKE